jgi:hypothetical protein
VKTTFAALGVLALLATVWPLSAHHSIAAEYDCSKPVSFKGRVVKMDWANPHSHLIFEVATADGRTIQWTAETPPPSTLSRAGWDKDTVAAGQELTVNGFLSKDGTSRLWVLSVDFADGRKPKMTFTRTAP